MTTVSEMADWLDTKADAVVLPTPGTGGIVEDRIGTAAWMAPALQEAARYRAAAKALRGHEARAAAVFRNYLDANLIDSNEGRPRETIIDELVEQFRRALAADA